MRRPSARKAVPVPIPVPRRPPYLAGPRWPVWGLTSGSAVAVVMLPALWQLAFRLLQAMRDTSVLLDPAPTRTDFLHAAAGVAGGGLTLALAIVAYAVVKGRPGFLGAALGVVTFFCVFPYLAYTANAGIVSAPVPPLSDMLQPPAWPRQTELGLVFWLAAGAALAAVADLLVRSADAIARTLRG
ncbi:MAG TPA: hypothetical protein VMM13_13975 [Euzebya sp.]|nr:hypothetical protein [Euzebya sp.]